MLSKCTRSAVHRKSQLSCLRAAIVFLIVQHETKFLLSMHLFCILFEMSNSGIVSVLRHIEKKNGQRAGHLTLNWDEILLTQRLQFQMYKYHLHHRLHDHYDHIPQAQLAKTDHPKYTDDCIEHSREDGKIQLTFPYVVIVDEVQHAGNGQRPQKRWRMSNY
ncbi:hypothetical protein T07_3382 [Trichinella nelsoni]|uniref:Uncharacterized protein n=1 Tax=Trichinella nelsoni TaxID=6336 RepID=A0A0V0RS68_9BILA|nr:hypothetical protein T07_3382 [Trichinella nelsoni]